MTLKKLEKSHETMWSFGGFSNNNNNKYDTK